MEKDVVLLLVGAIVGAMNAIAGGGMLIGFPVLIALGIPPLVANATGAVVTIPGQITSAISYRKHLAKVPRRYALLIIPCLIGALAGALTLRYTSADHFEQIVPVLVLLGVGLFAFQPVLHLHLHRHVRKRSRSLATLAVLGLALIPITFYGGYFGPGYGFLLLAFLGFTSLKDAHMMNAMKNVSAIFVAGTSVICLYSAHLIDWR
ncbi:MAG: hypothetical protein JWP13_735, partial [Candidatus Saccharibacteria bacterium]|nr:hypothetical protein [Candidatus Saccharibacteria bacterium]